MPLLMQKAGEGEVCCYGEKPEGVEVDVLHHWHPLVLIQPQWQACRVNLLHGEFSAKAGKGNQLKGLTPLLPQWACYQLGLLLGPRIAMAWMLVQQEAYSSRKFRRSTSIISQACHNRQHKVPRRPKY